MEGIRKIRIRESWARERLADLVTDFRFQHGHIMPAEVRCLVDLLHQVVEPPEVPTLIYWEGTQVELIQEGQP